MQPYLRSTAFLFIDFGMPAKTIDRGHETVLTRVNTPSFDARWQGVPATWMKRSASAYAYAASQAIYNAIGPITLGFYGYWPVGTDTAQFNMFLTKMNDPALSTKQPYVWFLDASGRQNLRRSGNASPNGYWAGYDSTSADMRTTTKPLTYMVTHDGDLSHNATFYTNGVAGTTTATATATGAPTSDTSDMVTAAYKKQGSAPTDYSDWIGYYIIGWNEVFSAARAYAWASDPMSIWRTDLSPIATEFLGQNPGAQKRIRPSIIGDASWPRVIMREDRCEIAV